MQWVRSPAAAVPTHRSRHTLRYSRRRPHSCACGRQSNMEFAVAEMLDAKEVIASSADPLIRLLSIAKVKSPTPLEDVSMTQDDGWQLAGPQSICGGIAKNGSQYAKTDYRHLGPGVQTPHVGLLLSHLLRARSHHPTGHRPAARPGRCLVGGLADRDLVTAERRRGLPWRGRSSSFRGPVNCLELHD
jgi:hypothetical protein